MSECMHVYATINDYHSQCRRCGVVITNPCRFPDCEKIRRERAELERQLAELRGEKRAAEAEVGRQICLNTELEQQLTELRELVNTFCEESNWAADTWKNQPHIKALFDAAAPKVKPPQV